MTDHESVASPEADPVSAAPGPVRETVAAAMDAYESTLLRYATQILRRHPGDAQDVVQEAFLRYYRALTTGTQIAKPNQWLYRVTHNLAIDLYRRRSKHAPLADDHHETPDSAPTAAEHTTRQELRDLAVAELHRLPEEQRQVVLLKILRGHTLDEISQITGLKVGTVYYRLNQGLRQLADRLKTTGAV